MKMTVPRFDTLGDAQAWAQRVYNDLEDLNRQLNDKADEYDLCDTYDEVLKSFNRATRTFTLDPRAKKYEAEITLVAVLKADDEADANRRFRKLAEWLSSAKGDEVLRQHVDPLGDEYEATDCSESSASLSYD